MRRGKIGFCDPRYQNNDNESKSENPNHWAIRRMEKWVPRLQKIPILPSLLIWLRMGQVHPDVHYWMHLVGNSQYLT